MKETVSRRELTARCVRLFVGLTICAVGEHFMVRANIGLAPWSCFAMGVANHTPLNYGLAMTLVSLAVLCADIALKERIGLGMLLDALYVGNMTDFFLQIDPIPEEHGLFLGVVLMVAGMVIVVLGQYFYMRAGLTCGPKDTLSIGLSRLFPKVKTGTVHLCVLAAALLAGFLLGGSVGIGTLITVFGWGSLMNVIFGAFRFDPREVEHLDFVELGKILFQK